MQSRKFENIRQRTFPETLEIFRKKLQISKKKVSKINKHKNFSFNVDLYIPGLSIEMQKTCVKGNFYLNTYLQ